jgi:CheY-like chemotaxis protein
VLIIEDSDADARLIHEGLKLGYPAVAVEICTSGAAAMDWIRWHLPGGERRPDLILLDWRLPGMDGLEILMELKNDNRFRPIPVAVLSGCASPADVGTAYAHSANCYVQKPVVLDEFLAVIAAIARFWLTVAELPSYNNGYRRRRLMEG